MVTIICKAAKPAGAGAGWARQGWFHIIGTNYCPCHSGDSLDSFAKHLYWCTVFHLSEGGTRGVIMAQERMEEFSTWLYFSRRRNTCWTKKSDPK